MIQGYAIYLRTHLETGKQYAGSVRGTKSDWTPLKGCLKRWKAEDKAGIRGFFGGFKSEIVLVEMRHDAPTMSDGLYQIRIAADETKAIDQIPDPLRLNKVAPFLFLNSASAREEICRAGGQVGGRIVGKKHKENKTGVCGQTPEQHSAASRLAVQANKKYKRGIFGMTPEQQEFASRQGGLATGPQTFKNKTGIFGRTAEQRKEDAKLGGRAGGPRSASMHRKNKTGVFAFTAEQQSAHGRKGAHMSRHVRIGFVKPNCPWCVQEKVS